MLGLGLGLERKKEQEWVREMKREEAMMEMKEMTNEKIEQIMQLLEPSAHQRQE